MDGDRCHQKGCTGTIDAGYCDVCGHAEPKTSIASAVTAPVAAPVSRASASASSGVSRATGSSPVSRAARSSRRTSASSRSSRKQLGAGLLTLPELPSTEPEKAVMLDPKVPERKRYCSACNNPLKREAGFCGKCGQRYSFTPSLKPGDLVAGQYQVKGALAYGGLGWIYLGFDNVLSRYVVLKGLLNAHDESSAAVALAERQFLAAVKHPNIVGIYNFVQHGGEGFIVMEYVGGKTLKQIRQERGPLPVAESIAYIHRILPAFSYLHQLGMVYCDFKPDNVMLEKDDVKLIDMGGVRRVDDLKGDIYGTIGYSAPEASSGPTIESDLFTIGRSLAVLMTQISGFSTQHLYTLPGPEQEPLYAQQESLYRFLLRATAQSPGDRFESADEMADQLLGVLREVVSIETGTPRPGISQSFGGDILALESGREMEPVPPNYRLLPMPSLDTSDPGLQLVIAANSLSDMPKRVNALRGAVAQAPKSREAKLRLAVALADTSAFDEAGKLLDALGEQDPWDWRVLWVQGRLLLARNSAKEAVTKFDQVYFDLPGEAAPKLALGLAAEFAGNLMLAVKMYDLVSRTDPEFVSAAFGLARCQVALGDRKAAVAALGLVPQSSGLYVRARVAAARLLIHRRPSLPEVPDLAAASAVTEALALQGLDRLTLSTQILSATLDLVTTRAIQKNATVKILGHTLEETDLRTGLETSLRAMAHLSDGEERIELVDRANQVRPRTIV